MGRSSTRRRLDAIVGAARNWVPRTVQPLDDELGAWRGPAVGMIARCLYLAESIRLVANREPDANILARSLWEHVVLFAWISADPKPRYLRWVAKGAESELNLNADAVAHGFPAMPPEEERALVAHVERGKALGHIRLKTSAMAQEADDYWSQRQSIGSIFELKRFGTDHAVYFRGFSRDAHPSGTGLTWFTGGELEGEIAITRPGDVEADHLLDAAGAILTALLLLAEPVLGWSTQQSLHSIWLRFPTARGETQRGG